MTEREQSLHLACQLIRDADIALARMSSTPGPTERDKAAGEVITYAIMRRAFVAMTERLASVEYQALTVFRDDLAGVDLTTSRPN